MFKLGLRNGEPVITDESTDVVGALETLAMLNCKLFEMSSSPSALRRLALHMLRENGNFIV